MEDMPLVLIVDDQPDNREILVARLESQHYRTRTACDGEEALASIQQELPDIILLDVMMPGIDGLEVCRRLRADPDVPFIPIILVTAKTSVADVVAGLDAGADDYLTKPVQHSALVARVRSMLRIKTLHDQTLKQKAELADWNLTLSDKVARQVEEIERTNRLRRFLSPQVAKLIITSESKDVLASHRADISVFFADLRGFTRFADRAAPEDVMAMLDAYHSFAGPLINQYEGTLERFAGDGIMVFFNDPVPCDDPTARAARLAQDMHTEFGAAMSCFQNETSTIGLGIGIAQGPATLGRIGFDGRFDYAAIGPVTNLAARLCDEAENGQTLLSEEAAQALPDTIATIALEKQNFKGFSKELGVFALAE